MSSESKIINGHLHSPYFNFIRAAGWLSDHDLLKLLDLGDLVARPLRADGSKPHIYFTESDAWIHIADDWLYSLWHKGHQIVTALHERAAGSPTFSCAVGDSDRSFDFAYYSSGALLRRLVVEDPHYDRRRRIVAEDFGRPFPAEKAPSEIDDEQGYVLSLAASVGVKINREPRAIRCYAKPLT